MGTITTTGTEHDPRKTALGIVDRDGRPAKRRHHPMQTLFEDYEWVHTGIGITGNALFFGGSILFLSESTKTIGVWTFIVGAFFMLIGSVSLHATQVRARRRPPPG